MVRAFHDPALLREVLKDAANEDAVLIGGMAVDFWCARYDIAPSEPFLTDDVDFFGGRRAVKRAAQQLAARRRRVRSYYATLDDATPNAGKLAVGSPSGERAIEIDFLFRVEGLSADDVETRSVAVEIDGVPVRVLHPVLCLESKVNNLAAFVNKRNRYGVEQARLSIAVLRSYLEEALGQRPLRLRPIYEMLERIGRFAGRDPACLAHHAWRLDVLDAIPAAALPMQAKEFRNRRLPQIRRQVAGRRRSFANLVARMRAAKRDPLRERFRT